jgi:hypothetical protein
MLPPMAWKKTFSFFAWQCLRYAQDWAHFRQMWSWQARWAASFEPGRNSVADELPWLNFYALDFLQQNLRPEFRVFEFGGGGSTLFFCKNTSEVVTVEDHAGWFETLTKTVRAKGYQHWRGFFVSPEPLENPRPRSQAQPADFKSGAKGLENLSFEKYARTIDPFPEGYFDLVLVDGRARPSCFWWWTTRSDRTIWLIFRKLSRPSFTSKRTATRQWATRPTSRARRFCEKNDRCKGRSSRF